MSRKYSNYKKINGQHLHHYTGATEGKEVLMVKELAYTSSVKGKKKVFCSSRIVVCDYPKLYKR